MHSTVLLTDLCSPSEKEGANRKSDSVCHRKRAQDTAKWRLDETVASLITSLKGRRKIAFLTEAQMAVIQAAESETSWPTRLSCPKTTRDPTAPFGQAFQEPGNVLK